MKFLMVFLFLFMIGCDSQYDGMFVKCKDGKVYQLEHRIGNTYFVNEIDVESVTRVLSEGKK